MSRYSPPHHERQPHWPPLSASARALALTILYSSASLLVFMYPVMSTIDATHAYQYPYDTCFTQCTNYMLQKLSWDASKHMNHRDTTWRIRGVIRLTFIGGTLSQRRVHLCVCVCVLWWNIYNYMTWWGTLVSKQQTLKDYSRGSQSAGG